MDCIFRVVLRRLTSIVCSEFRICLQESYVVILIIFTRVVFSSIIETSDHTRKTRPLSVWFNVRMYSWPRTPLSEYWRHHAYRVYSSFYMYAYIIPHLHAIILSILLTASPIYSYPELISILSWYCYFHVRFIFMNVYICVTYIYAFCFITGHHVRTV